MAVLYKKPTPIWSRAEPVSRPYPSACPFISRSVAPVSLSLLLSRLPPSLSLSLCVAPAARWRQQWRWPVEVGTAVARGRRQPHRGKHSGGWRRRALPSAGSSRRGGGGPWGRPGGGPVEAVAVAAPSPPLDLAGGEATEAAQRLAAELSGGGSSGWRRPRPPLHWIQMEGR